MGWGPGTLGQDVAEDLAVTLAAGIFPIAAENDAEALAICTVSDDIPNGKHLSAEERAHPVGAFAARAAETSRAAWRSAAP